MIMNTNQAVLTVASGVVVLEMALECKSGLMVLNMKVSGSWVELMARVNSIIRMETYMKESGGMT